MVGAEFGLVNHTPHFLKKVRGFLWCIIQSTMWNMAFVLKISGFVVAAGVAAAGVYEVARIYSVQSLKESIGTTLQAGDYVAAIAAYDALEKASPAEAVAEKGNFATAQRLLAAEEDLNRAKRAAARAEWGDVRALLRESEAIQNSAFARHQEAQELYNQAEAYAAGERHETAVALEELKGTATTEKSKRAQAEEKGSALQSALSQKEKELGTRDRELTEVRLRADETKEKLTAEEARTKGLAEQVEKEVKQKFFNEFRTYRDLAQKGREQLDNAVTEIQAKRDVTALVYISQGKILFEEAKNKTNDLRSNRTPPAYQPRVDDVLKALGEFLEASKQLRNAVAYIDEQGSAEFTSGLSKGKTALANGVSYLSGVSDFIAGNQ